MMLSARAPTMLAARNAAKRAAAPVPIARGRRAIAVRAAMPIGEVATLSAALTRSLAPTAASLKALNLPEPLIHWGHPGNMAVVLLAMLGYGGVYLGWQIRGGAGGDDDALEKARDLHPKLTIGAAIFFALGASAKGLPSLALKSRKQAAGPS